MHHCIMHCAACCKHFPFDFFIRLIYFNLIDARGLIKYVASTWCWQKALESATGQASTAAVAWWCIDDESRTIIVQIIWRTYEFLLTTNVRKSNSIISLYFLCVFLPHNPPPWLLIKVYLSLIELKKYFRATWCSRLRLCAKRLYKVVGTEGKTYNLSS